MNDENKQQGLPLPPPHKKKGEEAEETARAEPGKKVFPFAFTEDTESQPARPKEKGELPEQLAEELFPFQEEKLDFDKEEISEALSRVVENPPPPEWMEKMVSGAVQPEISFFTVSYLCFSVLLRRAGSPEQDLPIRSGFLFI